MALKGISGDGELGRGRCGGLGRCERSGLGCSMKWTAAELLDTVRRRGDDGEHGYDGGAAMVASAMAGACEGEGGPESEGEVRGGRGGAWRHRGVEEEPGRLGGRRWPGRVAARATEQLRGEGEEDDRGRSGGGLGRWRSWARWAER